MNDDTMQALCEEIVQSLKGVPLGMSQADIHANVTLAESPRDTARAIQALMERGSITSEVNGQWRLKRGGAGREAVRSRKDKPQTTEPKARTLIESILAVLGDKEMTPSEIAALLNESKTRIRENLTVNKKYGVAVVGKRGAESLWKRIDPSKAPVPRAGAVSRGTAPAKRDAPRPAESTAASGNGAATRALERAMQQAQEALDEYVASVCDPAVLGALRKMRDGAREAWRIHTGAPQ